MENIVTLVERTLKLLSQVAKKENRFATTSEAGLSLELS